MALTYKAAVLHAPKSPLAIETVEAAELAPGDVLIRVKAAGLCHTDLEVIEGSLRNPMPILLIPGLACSPRYFSPLIPNLWRYGPVTVANHLRDDNMGAIARRILAEAPPRFALAGHSMGGYIAFEIMRQAPERVARLALINTQARADTAEAAERRRGLMAGAKGGGLHDLTQKNRMVGCRDRMRLMAQIGFELAGRIFLAGGGERQVLRLGRLVERLKEIAIAIQIVKPVNRGFALPHAGARTTRRLRPVEFIALDVEQIEFKL